jgi:hypothetical protein
MIKRVLCSLLLISLASAGLAADTSFWQPGKVRELLGSGLPVEDEDLKMWADHGVNCITGVRPALAHAQGLKTRTWFTMNFMDSRRTPEEEIKAMAAIRLDGSYLRPFDPLFPTVGQYGWTACVENPLWRETTQNRFRQMAQDGFDGCHIDFASHYENCYCTHCQARFRQWAPEHGLGEMTLQEASASADFPVRMKLREFRIFSVMDFLAVIRQAAREINPDFATDGTWHHDNGSTYQFAYGEHFDLMCIEGTTWGPFPPASTQVPFLKLAHALSRRPDRSPVAMSVTYHLLTDQDGKMFHGRMAGDRVRVTLGELISEGGVSWLGLGGPATGNLLREHQDIVRAYYSTARDLEPMLVGAREVASIGLLFSPRSYLLNNSSRLQLYAFAQVLMKNHIPYRLLSDVNLQAGDLAGLNGLILLDGRALSDEACEVVSDYVAGGGQLLVQGTEVATIAADWTDRTERPAFAQAPAGDEGGVVSQPLGQGQVHYWLQKAFDPKVLGATQVVTFDPPQSQTLAIEGLSKAEGVTGERNIHYSLYVDLTCADGTNLWTQVATFDTGTHDWQFSRRLITSEVPVISASVHMLFRNHGGTAWFKDVRFGVWDEERQQIVENLLGQNYVTPDGKTIRAAGDGPDGQWVPYGEGYSIENMLEQGWWVQTSAERGLELGAMNVTDPTNENPVMEVLQPLLPRQPALQITGEGAGQVVGNLTRTDTHLTLHLVNYAAHLDPTLSEAEQQEQEHSLPARNLQITLNLPDLTLKSPEPRLFVPEGEPQLTAAAQPTGVRVQLSELTQYLALVWELN